LEASETTDRADEDRGVDGTSARALVGKVAPIAAVAGGLLLVGVAMIYSTRGEAPGRRAPAAIVAGGPPPVVPATVTPVAPPLQQPLPGAAPSVQFLERAPAIFANAICPHEDRGQCTSCHRIKPVPAVAPVAFPIALVPSPIGEPPLPNALPEAMTTPVPGDGQQVAAPAVDAQTGASPRLWVAAPPSVAASPNGRLPFQEGHWQGLEVISLTPGLARVLGIPRDVRGVVIDEVTMPADTLGFQAGDVIVDVGDVPTPDLEAFIAAADIVRDQRAVAIDVYRKGDTKTLALVAKRLGTANGETAPMIPPGAQRPHGYLGPCTSCHRIGTKGSLPVDVGDVRSLTAPVIQAGQVSPHEDRGACSACHVIQ